MLDLKVRVQQGFREVKILAEGQYGWRHLRKIIMTTSRFKGSEENLVAESDAYGRSTAEGTIFFSYQSNSGIYVGRKLLLQRIREKRFPHRQKNLVLKNSLNFQKAGSKKAE